MRRMIVCGLIAVVAAVAAPAAFASNYVVLYKQQAVGSDAAAVIQSAGGTLVYSYPEIGVVIASSSTRRSRQPAQELEDRERRVDGGLRDPAADIDAAARAAPKKAGDLPNMPATDTESLSALQWDMRQIHTPEAHAITGGSPTVLVGDIDTGLDPTHPDLAAERRPREQRLVRRRRSRTEPCRLDGRQRPRHAHGRDDRRGGERNRDRRRRAERADRRHQGGQLGRLLLPGGGRLLLHVGGEHGIDVTNNSYFADPYLFNCKNDPVQRAIWKAESRAIQFAQKERRDGRRGGGQPERGHLASDAGRDEPRRHDAGRAAGDERLHRDPDRDPGVIGVTANGNDRQDRRRRRPERLPQVVLLELRHQRGRRRRTGRRQAVRRHAPRPSTGACSRRGRRALQACAIPP